MKNYDAMQFHVNKSGSLRDLAAELVAVQKRAKELGLFTNDRELLTCPGCGLTEDVQLNGQLTTYFGLPNSGDSGLRFIEAGDEEFICPKCGLRIQQND